MQLEAALESVLITAIADRRDVEGSGAGKSDDVPRWVAYYRTICGTRRWVYVDGRRGFREQAG